MVVFAEGFHWFPWDGESLGRYGLSLTEIRPANLMRSR